MRRGALAFLGALLLLAAYLVGTRYSFHYVNDTGTVFRADRLTGRLYVISPEILRSGRGFVEVGPQPAK